MPDPIQSDTNPEDREKPQWLMYEQLAAKLLNDIAEEFGLQSVEGKQKIQSYRSGRFPEIDAKGITKDGKGFFIVECKHHPEDRVGVGDAEQLAYRILDTRADGAIFVSPMGLAAGAKKIAEAESIVSVRLDADSTFTDFVMQFLDKIRIGLSAHVSVKADVNPRLMRACANCGKTFPQDEHETLCSDCR